MKDKIIRKITSCKFILCVIAFVTSLLTFLKVDQGTTESITDVANAGKDGDE